MEQLRLEIWNSDFFSALKKNILKFIRRSSHSIFNFHSPNRIKLITRLGLSFSHLPECKFHKRTISRILLIQFPDVGITLWLQCYLQLPTSLSKIFGWRKDVLGQPSSYWTNCSWKNDSQISELLLFGVLSNNNASDTCILNPIIQYVLITWKLDFTIWIHMLTLSSPTKLHSTFNDNRLFVSFILLSLLF